MRCLLLCLFVLLALASPAHALLPTSTVTRTYTRTPTRTPTITRTSSATATRTGTPTITQTRTRTATRTATGTITPTPNYLVIYNRDGRVLGVPIPLPTGAPAVVVNSNEVGIRTDGGGGGGGPGATPDPCTTLGGATKCPDGFTEDVATNDTETFVETVTALPANAIVDRCFAKTLATLVTSNSQGVEIGLEGATRLWGTLAAAINSTTTSDIRWPAAHAIYTDTPVRITVTGGGTFSNNTGSVRIVCFYTQLEGIP